MTALWTLPIVGAAAAAAGALLGLRGPLCGAVVAIATATAWSLT